MSPSYRKSILKGNFQFKETRNKTNKSTLEVLTILIKFQKKKKEPLNIFSENAQNDILFRKNPARKSNVTNKMDGEKDEH